METGVKELNRSEACKGCPFRKEAPPEAVEGPAHDSPLMLCHESGCLDGEGTTDYICKGWQDAKRS